MLTYDSSGDRRAAHSLSHSQTTCSSSHFNVDLQLN
ncbi:hypothetical protein RB213_008419 [Colletotrichum asianum]